MPIEPGFNQPGPLKYPAGAVVKTTTRYKYGADTILV